MGGVKTSWYVVCVVLLLVVAGFVGFGSAQQTPNTAANTTMTTATTTSTTTTTVEQGVQTTDVMVESDPAGGPASPSPTGSTASTRSSTATPDADDNWQSATRIDTDRTVNETLPVGDQDWLVFSVEETGSITVRLAAANQTDMSGFLYSSGGDLLDSSYVAPGEQLSLTGQASSEGEYYVFVRNEANNTPGAYAFEVSVSESEAAAGENQPQTADGTSGESGPGFGLLSGLVAALGAGYLLVRTVIRSN